MGSPPRHREPVQLRRPGRHRLVRPQIVSKLAAERFLGYLNAQNAAMTGEAGAHTNRLELVAVHGYDNKYAMHALRPGLQGVELLTTGRITLPVPEPHRSYAIHGSG